MKALLITFLVITAFAVLSLMFGNDTSVSISNWKTSLTVQSSQQKTPITQKKFAQETDANNSKNSLSVDDKTLQNSNLEFKQKTTGDNSPNVIEIK